MLPVELIKKKRDGQVLTKEEIHFFISEFLNEKITDYQMSALLMAIFFKGMTHEETLHLTHEMLHSGEVLDFSSLGRFCVDKHSTGGVGDKTSLILAPIVASLGIPVPMISGRGLGHTGGTLDKLEAIPGFNTQISLIDFKKLVEKYHIGLIGQTKTICPADKRIYALRDVTGTVESLPLICASIMSKKLAEGINGLVLDVKYGSGAFMKSQQDAKALALGLSQIAKGAGKKVVSLITNMSQPLGAFAGNSLETQECVEIMQGQKRLDKNGQNRYKETLDLSVELAAQMAHLATGNPIESCREQCLLAVTSGAALKTFEKIVEAQGGDLSKLPTPKCQLDILSLNAGFVESFDVEKIGWVNVSIGAGRRQVTDIIEPTAGIEFHAKIGDPVTVGSPLFTLYGDQISKLEKAKESLLNTIKISPQPQPPIQLISEVF